MESPLEVLSRAVCMLQDNGNESRLITKELPTTKWRRDRRTRATASEYQISTSPLSQSENSPNQNSQASPQVVTKPLTESTNTNGIVATSSVLSFECPIDMSVTSTTIKPRSPPPPYREPLPGSTFSLAARPSVITQAPPKRNNNTLLHQNTLISNRENNLNSESISMCDPVIDEHFRRSLGADYMALFDKKTSPPKSLISLTPTLVSQIPLKANLTVTSATNLPEKLKTSQLSSSPNILPEHPQHLPVNKSPSSFSVTTKNNDSIAHSVDDHFAKALGDTWKKLQADKEAKNDEF